MQRGFLSLDVAGDALTLDPVLPGHLASLAVSLRFRGRPLGVAFSEGQVTLGVNRGVLNPLGVRHWEKAPIVEGTPPWHQRRSNST